ncbi:hypothetical protein J3Q64DRAFT_1718752 [Phycomyces blakesleeanus]|uniref:F-box domain-containing protein n=2 Tax=Phycomyces blakesleeanus TaxID=4837 RepID=A0A167PWK6_PHYB8|nr:hypothetical protein PHYBLDRAFT_77073 [Phycomyces blakesleeanus NRRL 1555(-)]OAD78666.1 hypothetical protein PHYBLDRAFT_77073 [Phycomyces blakesleeanus NRRL 1555(-)]|eukprot:XP_018296706.1 hypothetical protein PHYBLDRAFT_77073 [Phycomyces blakesleeanus NRRL 1555(-)]
MVLLSLPSEVLWQIVSFLDITDLSVLRFVSTKLRTYADHPSHWKDLQLRPPPSSTAGISLWNLNDLKDLIGPHASHTRSIKIWGVRDTVVRFLITRCTHLQELTICGWATLSDHAFRFPATNSTGGTSGTSGTSGGHLAGLRRLEFVGATQQSNYTALGANTLGRILTNCPDLSELLLGCQVHIHAQTLIEELKKSSRPPLSLRSLTLATHRTWSAPHITHLFDLCPSLEQIGLLPAAASGCDVGKDSSSVQRWLADTHSLKLEHSPESPIALDLPLDQDMVIYRPTCNTTQRTHFCTSH